MKKSKVSSNIKKGRRKNVVGFIATGLLVLMASVITYDLVWHKPLQLESGIVQQDKTFYGHTKDLWAVQFSPDGALVASGGVDSTVKIWRKDNGAIEQVLKHPIGITTLGFCPGGKYLATGSYDAKVRLWNLAHQKVEKEFNGHAGTVWSVACSPDGKMLATSGEDRTIKLWDIDKGVLIQSWKGHSRNIWKVRFTPDGSKIVSSSFDQTIKIWDTKSGRLLNTLAGHNQAVVGLAISPDGQTIASASDDKTVKLWNLQNGKVLHTLKGGYEHVYAVAFSPDGKRLVSSNRDRSAIGEAIQNFFGNIHFYKGVTMRLWDVQTGGLLQTFAKQDNDVMDVAFSADGNWIASASDDKTVQLWRVVK